ncbi:MAG: hypothetical protein JNM70_15225 [Anaerolineae bacterium]|nr:hypothetical protein [Anaerolineae bacterium]
MAFVETSSDTPSNRERWNHLLAIVTAVVLFAIGVNLRDSAIYASTPYNNLEAGIRVEYPRNWLIDTADRYILRVRDLSGMGFKTTLQISLQPVGAETSYRTIFDGLTLNRSQILAAYRELSRDDEFLLPNEVAAASMSYTYADLQNDPFQQAIPSVVRGTDVVVIRRGQAIIITFLADASSYQNDLPYFDRFLRSLDFQ